MDENPCFKPNYCAMRLNYKKKYDTLALYRTLTIITTFSTGNHIENSPILLSKFSMYGVLQKIAGVKVLIVIEENSTLPTH